MGKMCFVGGIQKCGTSTLYALLCQHPDIGGAQRWETRAPGFPPKELHFFNTTAYRRGLRWYNSQFGAHKWHVDATPEYMTKFDFLGKIARDYPDSRLIIMIRDPVERAMSAWRHWKRLSAGERWVLPHPGGTLLQNLKHEAGNLEHARNSRDFRGFISRGVYVDQVLMAHELFGKGNVAVVFLEDLVRDTQSQVDQLFDWLNIPRRGIERRHVNQGSGITEDDEPGAREFLAGVFEQYNEKLASLMEVVLPVEWMRL